MTSAIPVQRAKYIQNIYKYIQIYELHITEIIIHHLDGLFGLNILTSSQLAC